MIIEKMSELSGKITQIHSSFAKAKIILHRMESTKWRKRMRNRIKIRKRLVYFLQLSDNLFR